MLTWEFLVFFIPACFALNAAPGPNNLLAFSNASRLGFTPAIIGGTGRLPAFAMMILLVALGLGAMLAVSETAFAIVKYAGAAYLIWIGWKMWHAPLPTDGDLPKENSLISLMQNDFLIAIGNPKAIAIFTAFFPQFVDFNQPVAAQFFTLGALFLGMELLAVALYAILGRAMSHVLTPLRLALLNKGVGGFLMGSGVYMALSHRNT